jgi:bifunctional DNA-binding transcriptional regulator/antitoxin component of YhaV-PrlF toxin-antitoxin module
MPAAVRRFLGVSKGGKVEFVSQENGEVIVRAVPTLDVLFGSLKGEGEPMTNEPSLGWKARSERVIKKGLV